MSAYDNESSSDSPPPVDDPLAQMELKLQTLEDRLLLQQQPVDEHDHDDADAAASAPAVAEAAASGPPNDPMMEMLQRMEQKIESLQTRREDDNDSETNDSNDVAAAAATGKRKRGRPPNNQQQPMIDSDDNLSPPNSIAHGNGNNNGAKDKITRINWAKSPHRERLSKILNDWFSQSGLAIDDEATDDDGSIIVGSGKPITCYRKYAAKVGISRTTLYKYVHKDPSKRRLLKGEGEGGRGKKRLIDGDGVRFIVAELKNKADVAKDGFSRQEATNIVMEHFGLSRNAASRQLSRHILPAMMSDGMTLRGEDAFDMANHNGMNLEHQTDEQRKGQEMAMQQPQQPRRNVVISGVASGFGRSLFQYYYLHGHNVAGCARNHEDIEELQSEFPEAQLSSVDVSHDGSVAAWVAELEENGIYADLIIADEEIAPESISDNADRPMWEVPLDDFDKTIDVNVKGVSNMVRHFVPRMIHNHCGTFVAMSSGLGRSPNPHHAAYCASKFAIEGLIKSVAMSLPNPLCAVPLAPGIIKNGEGGVERKHHPNSKPNFYNEPKTDIDEWVNIAGPMLLRLNQKDNGKSVSVKGFYSVRDRQSWIIQDGTGVPMYESTSMVAGATGV